MTYQFDHAWHKERERLAALENAFDPWSRRAIDAIAPIAGWRCLEVGAGGGSMAEWLCGMVGPEGSVVATDLETKFLQAIEAENLEVRAHDIVSDPMEENAFDLIHVRAVLGHLPERGLIVDKLISALVPGGWLVPLVADFSSVRAIQGTNEDVSFFNGAFAAAIQATAGTGFAPFYGRSIGSVLRSHGLENVHVEGIVFEGHAGHPLAELYRMTIVRLKQIIVGGGTLSETDFKRLLAVFSKPGFFGLSNTLFLARGRKKVDQQG